MTAAHKISAAKEVYSIKQELISIAKRCHK